MGLFSNMGKGDEELETSKEEKKKEPQSKQKTKKGKVSLIIVGKKIIIDVDGNGEEVKYNERDHGNLSIGDMIVF